MMPEVSVSNSLLPVCFPLFNSSRSLSKNEKKSVQQCDKHPFRRRKILGILQFRRNLTGLDQIHDVVVGGRKTKFRRETAMDGENQSRNLTGHVNKFEVLALLWMLLTNRRCICDGQRFDLIVEGELIQWK